MVPRDAGDGRSVLRSYGLACTHPSQLHPPKVG